jgi:hypothetical protein
MQRVAETLVSSPIAIPEAASKRSQSTPCRFASIASDLGASRHHLAISDGNSVLVRVQSTRHGVYDLTIPDVVECSERRAHFEGDARAGDMGGGSRRLIVFGFGGNETGEGTGQDQQGR